MPTRWDQLLTSEEALLGIPEARDLPMCLVDRNSGFAVDEDFHVLNATDYPATVIGAPVANTVGLLAAGAVYYEQGALALDAGTADSTGVWTGLVVPSIYHAGAWGNPIAPPYDLRQVARFRARLTQGTGPNGAWSLGMRSASAPLTTTGSLSVTANAGWGFRVDGALSLFAWESDFNNANEADSGIDLVLGSWYDFAITMEKRAGAGLVTGKSCKWYFKPAGARRWRKVRDTPDLVFPNAAGPFRPNFGVVNSTGDNTLLLVDRYVVAGTRGSGVA